MGCNKSTYEVPFIYDDNCSTQAHRLLLTDWPAAGKEGEALHRLPVLGCRASASRGASMSNNIPCFVGSTGMALGSVATAEAPDVWSYVDAVLNVSLDQSTRHDAQPSHSL